MGGNFEQQRKLLHDRYGALSTDGRRQMLCELCKRNILVYRQLEHLEHDLFRLESGRVQCELEGNQAQVKVVETKILEKKEQFLKALIQNKK